MKNSLLFLFLLVFISCSQESLIEEEDCSYPDFKLGSCPLETIIYKGQWEWLSHYYAQDSIGHKLSHWDDEQHKTIFHTDSISLFDTKLVIRNISFVENGIGIFCLIQHNGKDVYFKGGMGAYLITNNECKIIAIGKDNNAIYSLEEPKEHFMLANNKVFVDAIKERQNLSPCFQKMLKALKKG